MQVGLFFGAFDQQHPTAKFSTTPRERWDVDRQYTMIASVVNFQICEIRGSLVDPLTENLVWRDYLN